jgi:hypothetical protein
LVSLLLHCAPIKDAKICNTEPTSYVDPSGMVNAADLQEQMQFLARVGQVKSAPELATFIDTRCAEQAVQKLGVA